jgi:hypothetical protein
MRRYLPLIALIIIGLAILGWQLSRHGGKLPVGSQTGQATAPAKPLQPLPPYVQAATDFLLAWSVGDAPKSYEFLSAGMKRAATPDAWAKMIAGSKFGAPQCVASVGNTRTAYVVFRVQAQPRPKGEQPFSGYALLMEKEGNAWHVGPLAEQEKINEKYTDLRLSPGKQGGWVVTYQTEKGQIATITLPEM